MESVQLTDQQSAAVVKSPSTRVSLADIEANIAGECYVPGDLLMRQAIQGELAGWKIAPEAYVPQVLDHLRPLTICMLTLRNGFTVIGKAAPADPTNFNPELGRKFAREDAIRQIWPIMGYELRERLARGGADRAVLDRIAEIADTAGRRIETAMDGCDRILTLAKAAGAGGGA